LLYDIKQGVVLRSHFVQLYFTGGIVFGLSSMSTFTGTAEIVLVKQYLMLDKKDYITIIPFYIFPPLLLLCSSPLSPYPLNRLELEHLRLGPRISLAPAPPPCPSAPTPCSPQRLHPHCASPAWRRDSLGRAYTPKQRNLGKPFFLLQQMLLTPNSGPGVRTKRRRPLPRLVGGVIELNLE
jgi:hypothetical protein